MMRVESIVVLERNDEKRGVVKIFVAPNWVEITRKAESYILQETRKGWVVKSIQYIKI